MCFLRSARAMTQGDSLPHYQPHRRFRQGLQVQDPPGHPLPGPLIQHALQALECLHHQASIASAELLQRDGSLQVDKLAREEANGRHIKNIVRTAFALAISDETTIRLEGISPRLSTRVLGLVLCGMPVFGSLSGAGWLKPRGRG